MSPLFTVLYVIGITAESVTAALSAGRQKFDLFGVIMVAAITALGGGAVRDILLDAYPLTWVEHPIYLVIVVAAAVVTVSLSFLMHYFRHVFLVLDALGLAVFSVLGAQVALGLGHGFVIATVSSVVTGVSGGIMRDLLSDRVPLVFSGEYYAAISVAATALYLALLATPLAGEAAAVVTVAVALVARLAAIYFKKGLPVFDYQGKDTPVDPRLRLSARLVRDGARASARVARKGAARAGRSLRFDAAAYRTINRQTGKHARGSRDRDPTQEWVVSAAGDAARTRHAKLSASQTKLPRRRKPTSEMWTDGPKC